MITKTEKGKYRFSYLDSNGNGSEVHIEITEGNVRLYFWGGAQFSPSLTIDQAKELFEFILKELKKI